VKTLNLLRLAIGHCLWALLIVETEVLFEHQYVIVESFGVLILVAKKTQKKERKEQKNIYQVLRSPHSVTLLHIISVSHIVIICENLVALSFM
jgi:hypothetical protein